MSATRETSSPERDDVQDVVMPALSRAKPAAAIVRWLAAEGEAVEEGDVLAEVAAGNVTMEVEAACAGILVTIVSPADTDAKINAGTVIARIATQEDDDETQPAAGQAGTGEASSTNAQTQADSASMPGSEMTYADALKAALTAQMLKDDRVFVIGEGVAGSERVSPVVQGLVDAFGTKRVVETPIIPHAMTGLAAGAAMAGLKPVVEFMTWSLALQAIDPIVSTAAKTRYRSGGELGLPMVLRARNGRWPGTGPMHSVSLAAWFAHIPGLKVVAPATPACAKGLMHVAIEDPDPVIILEADSLYETAGHVPDDEGWTVPIGKARVAREGRDITLVAYSSGVAEALGAASALATKGIEAEVIDLRSLRPLDRTAIETSVKKTGRLLCLDEGWTCCSIAAEVCAHVAGHCFADLKSGPVRMTAADTPVPAAPNLEQLIWPAAGDVAARALKLMESPPA